ncbi:MAG: hypothetical protein ABIL09_11530 [Gemmatimonadota bacterium]
MAIAETGSLRRLSRPCRQTTSVACEPIDPEPCDELSGAPERARGFLGFLARFDAAQVLDLCWRLGAGREEGRVAGLLDFVGPAAGEWGPWEYGPSPRRLAA